MSTLSHTVYRPRILDKVSFGVAAIFCFLFLGVGLAFFLVVGLHLFSFVFTGLGLIGITACVSLFFSRTVVSSEGISKRRAIFAGFALRWADIDSWVVVPPQFDDRLQVRFQVRGRRFPRIVCDYEVSSPGFETFLRHVREYAAQKESANKPGQARS
jgi:hypothetical protein